jgi:membrane protease YdiL (CAAX protease family)
MKNRRGVVAYLLIAFGMAWAGWEVPIRLGISMSNTLFFKIALLVGAFAPAIAAFVVRKWITREGFADAGLRLNLRKWPYYLVALLLPLVVVGCIVVLAPLFGIGAADFSLVRGFKYLEPAKLPEYLPRSLWMLTGLSLVKAIFVAPILFGEEFGWRGYLQPRLFPDWPALGAVVTGVIWAYWHLPLNLRGGNFPDHPFIGGLLIYPVGAIFLSIIFGWLVLKTGSIWSSSLAHAATNAVGGTLVVFLFMGGPSLVFVSYVGLLGLIPLGALSAWIVLTGRLKPANDVSRASHPGDECVPPTFQPKSASH